MKTIGATAASHDKLPQGMFNEAIKQYQWPEIVDSTLLIYKAKQYDKKKEGVPTGEPGFKLYFFLFDFSAYELHGIVKAMPGWTFAGGTKVITQLATLTDTDYPLACQVGKVGEWTPKPTKENPEPGIVAIRALVDPDNVDIPGLESFLKMYPTPNQLESLARMIVQAKQESQLVPTRIGA
jgi:hypothetical protein